MMKILAVCFCFSSIMVIAAPPAVADNYRMINRDNPKEMLVVKCVHTPRNPTLNWIRRNCTPVDAQQVGTGPIIDVLYSAAGNSGDDHF